MIATTWTDVAAAISANVLKSVEEDEDQLMQLIFSGADKTLPVCHSHPSVFAQSRLGPRTMAILLGLILLTSLS